MYKIELNKVDLVNKNLKLTKMEAKLVNYLLDKIFILNEDEYTRLRRLLPTTVNIDKINICNDDISDIMNKYDDLLYKESQLKKINEEILNFNF